MKDVPKDVTRTTQGINPVCCVQPEVIITFPVRLPALPVNLVSTRLKLVPNNVCPAREMSMGRKLIVVSEINFLYFEVATTCIYFSKCNQSGMSISSNFFTYSAYILDN